MSWLLLASIAAASIASSACTGDEDPCVAASSACAPLYAPRFDEVFARTLLPSCGVEGASCHSSAAASGGLVLDHPDRAYGLLLGRADGRARVLPGDPECSILIARIASPAPNRVMPPGSPLGEAERCSVIQWIERGATR